MLDGEVARAARSFEGPRGRIVQQPVEGERLYVQPASTNIDASPVRWEPVETVHDFLRLGDVERKCSGVDSDSRRATVAERAGQPGERRETDGPADIGDGHSAVAVLKTPGCDGDR